MSKTLHVALVALTLEPGGTERCIARIADGLDRDRFQISVICLDAIGSAVSWITRDDVQVIALNCRHQGMRTTIKELAKCFARIKPDVVQSHNWGTILETHLAAQRHREIAHVHSERGTVLGTNPCHPLWRVARKHVTRWVCRRADAVTTNAYCVAEKVRQVTGMPLEFIIVIPNGVDFSVPRAEQDRLRQATREEIGIGTDDFLTISVGRLAKVKRFSDAIEAMAKCLGGKTSTDVKPLDVPLKLAIVGDGPCREELSDQIKQLNLQSNVHLLGEKSDAWRYLLAADLYINTSESEGMSQALLEAMAAGLPSVATDVGDARAMLQGDPPSGVVIPVANTDILAKEIAEFGCNREKRLRCADAAGRCHRQRYSLAKMIGGYEELYRKCVANRRGTKSEKSAETPNQLAGSKT